MAADETTLELMAACRELARRGAATAAAHLGRVQVSRKSDNSPVTQADHAAQAAILDVIAARFPQHAVLGEEALLQPARHAERATGEYCWVIDPIDGTRNFARGISLYATSVAVLREGRPVAGAIYDAAFDRVYSAAAGGGAFIDDAPLQLDAREPGPDTTIMISSFRRAPIPPAVRGWMDEYLFRNVGSLCLHLAWVAAGMADAAYAMECKLWDLAAGALIVDEAGAIATGVNGEPLWPRDVGQYAGEDIPILIGSPPMHRILLTSLTKTP